MDAERQSVRPAAGGAERPLLVYDGDCGFCLRWILRWRGPVGERVEFAPYQRVGARFPRIGVARFKASVWLFEPGGACSSGAEAVFRCLATAPGWRWPLLLYRVLPGLRRLSEAGYRFVAAHRHGLSRLERWLVGRHVVRSEWRRSRRLFLAGLGLVALIAFLSLWTQADGLMGSRGIVPVEQTLEHSASAYGARAWLWQPTLLRLAPGDALLAGSCAVGVLLSLLLLLGVAPALCALGIWAAYLSLVQAGGPFLSFQWDTLLIETSLLAVWYAPWRLLRGRGAGPAPAALARWLVWWLLFRFMFESGAVKLSAGDPAWPGLTALSWHYWTQPLPNAVSWWAYQLPLWVQQASALGTFVIELAVPLLIFAPRRLRHLGAAAMIGLQLLIGATGNYGFFNLLTIVLCGSLLDDQILATIGRCLRRPFRRGRPSAEPPRNAADPAHGAADPSHGADAAERNADVGAERGVLDAACGLPRAGDEPLELPPLVVARRPARVQRVCVSFFALGALVLGGAQIQEAVDPTPRLSWNELRADLSGTYERDGLRRALKVIDARASSFLSVNGYGLFRVMTKTRPEIVVQGSADGETWVDYDFRWKPDPLDETLHWAQPHMPRLDWQLWFEALAWEPYALATQPFGTSNWFGSFLEHLLEGEPAVLDLLAANPFPDQPPLAVRATLYWYGFTDPAERARTGSVWTRRRIMANWIILSRQDR